MPENHPTRNRNRQRRDAVISFRLQEAEKTRLEKYFREHPFNFSRIVFLVSFNLFNLNEHLPVGAKKLIGINHLFNFINRVVISY